ncbi:hypothetical protein MesoLjLc_32240 [Mesorhizobium sp. L-8-10]|uniref:tripartite tricarboxylate transporter permease n=1 Tax=Mesorhizobium sp. L-8-10 TaxID=2744523 RepID=UPI001925C240|nr:tripartite tricarboxylate transporter permease [Mesorhizobium sp. L-8-10]BCH31294.1 hypothetical protein MesoLjLc_32240 [Mesorhizobium sp. L-8-10]
MAVFFEFASQFANIFSDPHMLFLGAAGTALGIVFGCLPGISSTMALAILLPISFSLTPLGAIIFLIAVFSASVFGGSISAILINIPGTPGAIVTQLDGYPMARSGRAGEALFYALGASTLGGVIGLVALILIAPIVAGAAMQFRSPEFAMATVFGLTLLAYSTPGATFLGILSGCIGLICGMVGFDSLTDIPRFDFGTSWLQNGINLVPVTIGLFGIAEIMRNLNVASQSGATVARRIGRVVPPWKEMRRLWKAVLRGSGIGIAVGAIPAAGSAIAVAVSYAQEQRLSPRGKDFGKGIPDGIVAPEASNNAAVGGALVPMMTLGIPGDTMTAVLMGALLIHGLRPGPQLFVEHADFVASVYVGLFLAILLTAAMGLLLMQQFVRLMQAPRHILVAAIILLCVIGSFTIRNNVADVGVMIAFSVIGFVMYKLEIPVAPLAFGLILGPILEENLRRSLIVSDGSWMVFVERPIALAMLLLSLAAVLYPVFVALRPKRVSADAGE